MHSINKTNIMSVFGWVLVLILSFLVKTNAHIFTQDLGGNTWSAIGSHPPSTVLVMIPYASVPGNIHMDWYNMTGKKLEQNPYYRFNDVNLTWIAEYNWKYQRTFKANLESQGETWLICEGLDTISNVVLNGEVLGNTDNMFLKHDNFNQLAVEFQSALTYTNNTNKTEPYTIPPECPPSVQHGFCHVNLIRKEQCSFSWDWGPAFATQGIWKPIYLVSFNEGRMTDVTVEYDWDNKDLVFELRFHIAARTKILNGTLTIAIRELAVIHSINISVSSTAPVNTHKIQMDGISFERWWPNGHGNQKLYDIETIFESQNYKDTSQKTIRFGFRKVELVQEAINGSTGLSFYFKINEKPIFIKGSNWIPADAFKNRLNMEKYENLLQSAKDANMNTLRVWGGGIYESDEFYEIADQLGIMIWHDFMFACALYPSNKEFFHSVSREINETLWRLKSHPSIIIWAGNNENEAALSTNWYSTKSHFNRYKKDYTALYIDTIGSLVTSEDTSRPFLTSSPTNGAETLAEGGVAKNPYDTHYGDVHYYNYNDDCMDWTKYPKTRFASEYGFQSWPSLETLEPVTKPEDQNYNSAFANHRQHHANGNQQMLNQIQMHFKLPNLNATSEFEDLIYLTQIMQALCYKSQTEFYRRSQSEIVNGEGHTMGALYWQLNDIWQAPTWSSIEYGGKWKAVHYFAEKFFAPVTLVAYDDDTTLVVYSISEQDTPIEPVTLVIELRQWRSFGIINSWTQPIFIPPMASKRQYSESIGTLLHYGGCEYKELCYFTIRLKEMPEVPTTNFYPVPLKTIEGLKKPQITVKSVTKIVPKKPSLRDNKSFEIILTSVATAAFVWLESYGVKGRFSDNGFLMDSSSMTIKFYAWQNVTADEIMQSLRIKSLADLYDDNNEKVIEKPSIISLSTGNKHDHYVYWLDQDGIQLAWAMSGLLFILFFASMLVCVVLRLNNPRHEHAVVITTNNSLQRKKSMQAAQQLLAPITNKSFPLTHECSDDSDESAHFVIVSKTGYGHNAKSVEIRFHII